MKRKLTIDNLTHFKGKLASRKGMGMELALLVLFAVFACSVLLVSSALLGKSNLNDRRDEMVLRGQVDMLAEQALENHGSAENGEYVATLSGNILTVTDKPADPAETKILLTVTLDGNRIVSWEYH